MRSLRQCLALVSFLCVVPAQQRTLVVDQVHGPYREIYAALLAGRPGDRIEVRAATYAPVTITYGVEIIADPGTHLGGLTITNISSIHAVRVDGLQVDAHVVWPPNQIVVQQCQGSVHLHQVNAQDGIVANTVTALAISNSTVVGAAAFFGFPASPGLDLTTCDVTVNNSSITGGAGGIPPPTGGPGILLNNSALLLSDCAVQGGQGVSVPYNLGCRAGDGGSGIEGVGSATPVIAIGSGSISGGQPGCCMCTAYGGAGVHNVSLMRVGPGVTVSYSYPPPSAIAEPPHLSMPLMLQQGGVSTVQVTGVSAHSVLLAIDIWNGYTVVPGVMLPFVLTAGAALYGFAPPSPGASVQFPLAIPAVPWLLQQFVHAQAVTVASNATLEFSNGGFGRIR